MSRVFTGTGDGGTTGLLGGERVPKYHPQPEAYGAVDEASAAFGLARAITKSKEIDAIAIAIQRDLQDIMAELSATPEHRGKFQKMSPDRVRWLEAQIASLGQSLKISNEFVIFGDSESGAAFNLARTIVRRAERSVAKLHLEGDQKYGIILQYLNRLSSLCFVLALWETQKSA